VADFQVLRASLEQFTSKHSTGTRKHHGTRCRLPGSPSLDDNVACWEGSTGIGSYLVRGSRPRWLGGRPLVVWPSALTPPNFGLDTPQRITTRKEKRRSRSESPTLGQARLRLLPYTGYRVPRIPANPNTVANYLLGEDPRLYNLELVQQICRDLNNAKDDPGKERELLSLLRAVIQDDQEDIQTRMAFLKKKYPQVISDANAAD